MELTCPPPGTRCPSRIPSAPSHRRAGFIVPNPLALDLRDPGRGSSDEPRRAEAISLHRQLNRPQTGSNVQHKAHPTPPAPDLFAVTGTVRGPGRRITGPRPNSPDRLTLRRRALRVTSRLPVPVVAWDNVNIARGHGSASRMFKEARAKLKSAEQEYAAFLKRDLERHAQGMGHSGGAQAR